MELFEYTAAELSAMLGNGETSSAEVTESVLGRIEAVEPRVGAYITRMADSARKQAAEADKRIKAGESNPMLGIPMAVKDNIGVKGFPLTAASKMLENYVPPFSATIIDRLEQAGAVFTGKANLDEFAMGSSCESSYFGPTRNPRDLACVPGGSSGGSAAALAAGEAILALGSDTGGSVRLPAAYCGVVGLKPTYGAVSRFGAIAFASSTDQISPMGRSVADAAALLGAIAGPDPMDATAARRSYPDFVAGLNAGIKGKVLGLPKEYFGEGVDKEVKDAVRAMAARLEQEGARVAEVSLPSTDYSLSAYYIITSAEASSNLARFDGVRYGYRAGGYHGVDELIEKSRSEGFGDEVKRRIMLGTNILSSGYYDAYYRRGQLLRVKIIREFDEVLNTCDLLLAPTSPSVAFRLGDTAGDSVKMYAQDICTVAISIAGLPAISVPCGLSSGGMPIGMQVVGPRFGEESMLQTAQVVENLAGRMGVQAL